MIELKNGAVTIQRAQVLDTLRGLALSVSRNPASFETSDYQAGFADALLCVATSIGAEDEFLKASGYILTRINSPQ